MSERAMCTKRGQCLVMYEPILAVKGRKMSEESNSLLLSEDKPITAIICGTEVNELHFTLRCLVHF